MSLSAREETSPTDPAGSSSPQPAPARPGQHLTPRHRRVSRTHLLLLLLIAGVGLLRGGYWVVATSVWSPVDELAHFDYVRSLSDGDGVPIVGRDLVAPEVLELAKESRTGSHRLAPTPPDPTIDNWGAVRYSYQGLQGPPYYALLAPVHGVARGLGLGILGQLYALRMATVLIALATVPLTYVLARDLFPRHPATWLLSPALLVVLSGFNGNMAAVNNDALVLPLTVAALIPMVIARRSLHPGLGFAGGFLLGMAVLTKTTALTMLPHLALLLAWVAWRHRDRPGAVLRFSAVFGVAALVPMLPWLQFNLDAYGALSPADTIAGLTGGDQNNIPFTVSGLRQQLVYARLGFYNAAAVPMPPYYSRPIELVVLAALLVGTLVAVVKGLYAETRGLLWLAVAFPAAFVIELGIVYGVFDGVGSIVGRHLYSALVPICILVAAGLVIALGRRIAVLALLLLAVVLLWREEGLNRRYIDSKYAAGNIGRLVPVVDHSRADYVVQGGVVAVTPPCPTEVVSISMIEEGPEELQAELNGGVVGLVRTAMSDDFVDYRLPAPQEEPFRLVVPADRHVRASASEPLPVATYVGGAPGGPALRLYCPVEGDPVEARFEQVYGPLHPNVSYDVLTRFGTAWAWLATGVTATTAAWMALDGLRRRRSSPGARR